MGIPEYIFVPITWSDVMGSANLPGTLEALAPDSSSDSIAANFNENSQLERKMSSLYNFKREISH